MAGATTTLQAMILNLLLRTQVAWKPAGIYIALLTTLPSDDAMTGAVEATGGNYARVQVTQADAQWDAPSGTDTSTTQNVNAIEWASVTWTGTVVGFAICDHVSNVLSSSALAWYDCANVTVGSGDTVRFAAGALDVTMA